MLRLEGDALRDEIVRLAPWHLDVELRPGVSTVVSVEHDGGAANARDDVTFIGPREAWRREVLALYPAGLDGRTVLDCACNCGGYSFWMRELGGGGGLGFDVRERWIEQARFLQAQRDEPADGLRFEVAGIEDLPQIAPDPFDVAIFKGIFYHLRDPIHGLRLVAERTRELVFVHTAARNDLPDGMLVAEQESTELPMSGVDGLCWLPTGPGVIAEILGSLGFPATRTTFWDKKAGVVANRGRLEVIGARDEAAFASFDAAAETLRPKRKWRRRVGVAS